MRLRRPAALAVALIGLPTAAIVPSSASASAGAGTVAGTVSAVSFTLDCAELGQVTVTFPAGVRNDGSARLPAASPVTLAGPFQVSGVDLRTRRAVHLGAAPATAVACTGASVRGGLARDLVPRGSALPAGVSGTDRVDASLTVFVTVAATPAPARVSAAAATPSSVSFPWAAQISAYLKGRSGVATVAVYDAHTGVTYAFAPTRTNVTASIVKADIMATTLRQAQVAKRSVASWENSELVPMIERSDNGAATQLWNHVGRGPGVAAFNKLVPTSSTTMGPTGYWGLTTTTAVDQTRIVRIFAYPNSVLSTSYRAYALNLMRHVTSSQRWGVSAGTPSSESIALKNGWLPRSDGWHINSIGYLEGNGLSYVIAVLTSGSSSMSYGVSTVEGVSRIIWSQMPRPAPSIAYTSSTGNAVVATVQLNGTAAQRTLTGSTWSSSQGLGGSLVDGPAVSPTPTGLLLAGRNPDGRIYYRLKDAAGWHAWTALAGTVASKPAVVTNGSGQQDLFVRSTSGTLWTRSYQPSTGWSAWRDLGGSLISAPAAAERPNGDIEVVGLGPDHALWHRSLRSGSWAPWSSLGSTGTADPAVAMNPGTGQLDVYLRGTDNHLWSRTLTPGSSWTAWRQLGGALTSGVAAATSSTGRTRVLVRWSDGRIWQRVRTGTSWQAWTALP